MQIDDKAVEAVAKAIRENVKVDATGLAPAVASVFIVGIEDAARAALSTITAPAGTPEAVGKIAKLPEILEGFADDTEVVLLTDPEYGSVEPTSLTVGDLKGVLARSGVPAAPLAGTAETVRIADAIEKADWSGPSIGNKLLLQAAVQALRAARPAAEAVIKPLAIHDIQDLHDAAEWLADIGKDRLAGAVSEAACMLEQSVCFVCGGDGSVDVGGVAFACENCSAPALPDGWVAVPEEPTREMMHAFWGVSPNGAPFLDCYRAMLAARPASLPDGWRTVDSAPTNRAILIHIPRLDYYGNNGVYAGMLVDMGSGRRWMTFGHAIGRDLGKDDLPDMWCEFPAAPANAEGGEA